MALIGNRSLLHKSPGTFLGVPYDRSAFSKHGMRRNAFQALDAKAAIPAGSLPPVSWVMPKTAGGMASHNAGDFALSAVAAGVMGYLLTGSAAITVIFAAADGQLITSGTGSAAMAITTNAPLLTASLNAAGSGSFSLAANAAIGALADLYGDSFFVLQAAGSMLPVDDTPPARTATASFYFSGSLSAYAVGHMAGEALPYTELSPQSLAAAVWQSSDAENNIPGTMGAKVNAAASAGDPWSTLLPGAYPEGSAGDLLFSQRDDVDFMLKILRNRRGIQKIEGVWTLLVYDDDGETPILSKALKDYLLNDITDLAAGVMAMEEASSV